MTGLRPVSRQTPAMLRPRSLLVVLGLALCACKPPASDGPARAHAAASSSGGAAAVPVKRARPFEPISAAVRAAVDAPDRAPDDRALDAGRHPAELLSFFGVAPGMKVAELQAGGGYTAELLARVVGPTGKVYGQNSAFVLDRFARKPWGERLEKPIAKGIVRLDRELAEPFPPEVTGLDVVTMILFYHDTVWHKVDRAKMNRAIHAALKPGGVYGIVDHSGRPGTGTTETETLHRIEESALRAEILAAGFRLAGEADFLRNPDDPRDWNDSPRVAAERRGTSDRFVLKFVKPLRSSARRSGRPRAASAGDRIRPSRAKLAGARGRSPIVEASGPAPGRPLPLRHACNRGATRLPPPSSCALQPAPGM